MDYFQIMALVMGGLMVVFPVLYYFVPGFWRKWADAFCPEKKPVWLPAVTIGMILLTLATWTALSGNLNAFNFIISFIITMGAVKSVFYLKYYEHGRRIFLAILNGDPLARHIVMVSELAMGLVILWIVSRTL